MTIFTGLYALAILPSIESSPFLDLSEIVLPPFARGLFIVSLFAIVASTIDSFTFISAYTLGRDLPIVLKLEISKMDAINHTRIGLFITTIISIILAIYFKNAVDIWYLVGSFTTPTLLIPLLCALYGIRLKNTSFVLILPLLASIGWHLHGVMNLGEEGFPVYLFNLDPMYPGIILSIILFYFTKNISF